MSPIKMIITRGSRILPKTLDKRFQVWYYINMAFFKESQPGAKNAWRRNLSAAMQKSARRRKCPNCQRGAAIKRTERLDTGMIYRECRYCGWLDVFDLDAQVHTTSIPPQQLPKGKGE